MISTLLTVTLWTTEKYLQQFRSIRILMRELFSSQSVNPYINTHTPSTRGDSGTPQTSGTGFLLVSQGGLLCS